MAPLSMCTPLFWSKLDLYGTVMVPPARTLGFPTRLEGPYFGRTMNVSDVYQYGTQHFGTTQAADALERSNSPE